jgi:single-stranded DNA-specific DHH superfamily exonuclease
MRRRNQYRAERAQPAALGCDNVTYLVPNRFEDGYGLSPEVVDQAHARGAQMIMTVDNGISSHAGVDHAHALGIPVLVTDHHLPGETLPAAEAIINPNLRDCDFPSKSLAGVGVAFYLMLALRTCCGLGLVRIARNCRAEPRGVSRSGGAGNRGGRGAARYQ